MLHFEHKVDIENGVRLIMFVVEDELKMKRDERTKQM